MPWSPRTNKPLQGPLRVHRVPKARRDKRRYMRAAYKRLRKRLLTRDPWCRWPDCIEAALEVDHIVPVAWGGPDDPDNMQGLCKRHHGRKTRLEGVAGNWARLRRILVSKGFNDDDLQRAEGTLSNCAD